MENQSGQIELKVMGLALAKTNSAWKKLFHPDKLQYTLVLSKKDDISKRIPMYIGKSEAQAIAVVIQKTPAKRPLTHELFKTATDQFNYKLNSIIITKVDAENIFHCTMHYSNDTKKVEIDARPADTIALALRHDSPIFINKEVYENFSVSVPE